MKAIILDLSVIEDFRRVHSEINTLFQKKNWKMPYKQAEIWLNLKKYQIITDLKFQIIKEEDLRVQIEVEAFKI